MAQTQQWTEDEVQAAMGLVDLYSSSAAGSDVTVSAPCTPTPPTAAIGKKAQKSVIHPSPEEDQFLIRGRRAGMTPTQLRDSGHLPSFQNQPPHQVMSRLRKLQRAGHDVTPRTDDSRKRSAARRTLEQTKEMNEIAAACRKGMTPKEILEAGIVKRGKKDERSLKQRIYRMGLRGLDIKPR